MKKSVLFAGAVALGLSTAHIALAQNSPEQGVNVDSATSTGAASNSGVSQTGPGDTMGSMVGRPQYKTDASPAAQADEPALPNNGETPAARPNTDYGTLEPGNADTTRDSVPSTTRNADNNETRAPLAGANSFTQAEAQRQIERKGYTQVSGLAKDDQSVWRGTALKSGAEVNVALDYRGNVTDSTK